MAPRTRRAALFAIAAVALGLRLWGIGFGATQPLARPDEQIFAIWAMRLFSQPYQGLITGWPEGQLAIWHAVLRGERLFFGDANLACLLAVRPLDIYLPVRAVSAVLGAATIFPVHGLARAWRSESAGICAALACAVNPLAVRDGHFAVADAALCFLAACCLWACARGWLIAAGAFAGAAFGTKYAAAFLVVPCAACAFVALRRGRRPLHAVLLPTLAALLALAVASPSVLRDPAAFWSGVQSHGARYGGGALRFYALTVLPLSFGWAGLALAAIGLSSRRAVAGAAFVLAFLFLGLAPLQVPYARYASPMAPALAAGLGIALAAMLERSRWAFAALAVVALGPPAARAVQLDRLLSREDTRDLAARWLVADGRPVESFGGWAHVHALERGAQEACAASLPPHLRAPAPTLAGESRQWREMVARGVPGWEDLGNALVRTSLDRAPLPEAQLAVEAVPPPGFENLGRATKLDGACWVEVVRFAPGPVGASERFDAFFVPLDPFSGAERPGPEVIVRRSACGNSAATRTR